MKSISKLIHQLLILTGIRTIITVIIHNNYIVYCKSNHKYYNLLPLEVGQKVWIELPMVSLRQYNIIKILGNNMYQILDIYKFYGDTIVNGDVIQQYLPSTILTGYIKGNNFIITGTE